MRSVFTDDLSVCYLTGSTWVEVHHIFGGFNRKRSTEYGYVIPIRKDLHPNGAFCTAEDYKEIDLKLKQMAQAHFEEHHGTREEFIREFGMNYMEEL